LTTAALTLAALTVSARTVSALTVSAGAVATLAIAIAITSITGAVPARATFAARLLLLCARAGGSRYGLAARRHHTFGPSAATPTPASARTIAPR
jgi:hypothetical protein